MAKKRLKEADLPTDYDTPTGVDWDTVFDDPMSHGQLSTDKVNTSAANAKGPVDVPKFKVGDRASTMAATSNITPTDDMRAAINSINIPDDMLDDMPDDEPDTINLIGNQGVSAVDPEHVPAVISREIAMSDPHAINPMWHLVANLPGNMSRAILTLGKALFKSFTRTPTESITMIGNVGGQGPNSTREVRSVAKWVVDNGTPVDVATIDFNVTIPGYNADVKHYVVGPIRFMIVKDPYGDYIYAWPNADSVAAGPALAAPVAPRGRTPHRSLPRR